MKNMKVIVGANFGDEGKGLLTDYFSSKSGNGIVARFSGGAQAGHTVVTPDGVRHVFSHFGAGTLAGLGTYLAKEFIVNPMVFKKELNELITKKVYPSIYIDVDCLVTTPFDMLINQIVEEVRGTGKHGSCGLGINETLKRSKVIPIRVDDLRDTFALTEKLNKIKDKYLPYRLQELGVSAIPLEFVGILSSPNLIPYYLGDVYQLLRGSLLVDKEWLKDYDNIIFEGSQGLLLDQNNDEYFPHLTPSNVGTQNAVQLIKDLKLDTPDNNLEVIYASRWYMTRHGAGMFNTEIKNKPSDRVVDITNLHNRFQGNLRFGELDLTLLENTISKDLVHLDGLNYKKSIALTCLDQVDDSGIAYIYNGKLFHTNKESFVESVSEKINPETVYTSEGITRKTVKEKTKK